jgi:hypothetical protein
MNTINDRIEVLIKALGFNSVNQFDIALDKARGTTWKITGSLKQKPGFEYLEIIKKRFPHVDGNWLLSGEGEMLYPEKLRKDYVEAIEQKLEMAERANRRYETMIDMAAQRRETNFQRLSKRTPAREIVVIFDRKLSKIA